MKFHYSRSILSLSLLFISGTVLAEKNTDEFALDTIEVSGSYIKTSSNIQHLQNSYLGILGQQKNLDAPLSVSSYRVGEVKNYNNLPDILRRDPSVRRTDPTLAISEGLFIRGFRMGFHGTSEYAFDGIYGVTPNMKMLTQGTERVDVIKGPGSALFGMSPLGATGGAINITPKRATGKDFSEIFGKYMQKNRFGTGFDISRRFLDRKFGARANFSYENGEAFIQDYNGGSLFGSLALDYTTDNFQTTFDYIHQAEKIDGMHRSFSINSKIGSLPVAPSGDTTLSMPWMYSDTISNMMLLKSQLYLDNGFRLGAYIGGGKTTLDRWTQNRAQVVNLNGDVQMMVGRLMYDTEQRTYGANLGYDFSVGRINNDINLQLSRYEDKRITRGFGMDMKPIKTNIYHPNKNYPQRALKYFPGYPSTEENTLTSLAVSDTISNRNENFFINIGGRWQKIETENAQKPKNNYSESAFIPFIGFTYKPAKNISLYTNYAKGLSFGQSVPANRGREMYANAFESLSPFESEQFEVGAKAEFGKISTALAVFQITKEDGEDSLIGGKLYRTLTAEQKNRGVEISAFGKLTDNISISGGLAYLDSKITQSKANPANIGKEATGTPKLKATLGIDVDIPFIQGLTWGNDFTYVSQQYYDSANSIKLDDFLIWDMNLRYKTKLRRNKELEFSLNLANVANKKYFDGMAYSSLNQGEPRNIRATLSYRF